MKEFKITFSEKVYFTTIVEANNLEEAEEQFMDGNFGDCEEIDRDYDDIIAIEEV